MFPQTTDAPNQGAVRPLHPLPGNAGPLGLHTGGTIEERRAAGGNVIRL